MSIEVWEGSDGPSAEKSKEGAGSSTYWATGSDVEADIIAAVEGAAPFSIDCNGRLAVRTTVSAKRRGPDIWECNVKYEDESSKESEEEPEAGKTYRFSFDTTGGDHEVSHSLGNVGRYHRTSANPAPDMRGAIGWDGKKLNGAKVVIPKLEFTVDIYYDPTVIDTLFAMELARKTGCINLDYWLGGDPGELLFLGANGDGDRPLTSGQRTKPAKVSFKFAANENRSDITIGDIALDSNGAGINGITKLGWDYLWVHYTIKDDGVNGISYPTPEWAYVERMYRFLDFGFFFGVVP